MGLVKLKVKNFSEISEDILMKRKRKIFVQMHIQNKFGVLNQLEIQKTLGAVW